MGLLLFSLTGCGDATESSENQQQATEKEPATTDHVLSDQQQMIEKAKATEQKIKEADEKRRQALDDQGD